MLFLMPETQSWKPEKFFLKIEIRVLLRGSFMQVLET